MTIVAGVHLDHLPWRRIEVDDGRHLRIVLLGDFSGAPVAPVCSVELEAVVAMRMRVAVMHAERLVILKVFQHSARHVQERNLHT